MYFIPHVGYIIDIFKCTLHLDGNSNVHVLRNVAEITAGVREQLSESNLFVNFLFISQQILNAKHFNDNIMA